MRGEWHADYLGPALISGQAEICSPDGWRTFLAVPSGAFAERIRRHADYHPARRDWVKIGGSFYTWRAG